MLYLGACLKMRRISLLRALDSVSLDDVQCMYLYWWCLVSYAGSAPGQMGSSSPAHVNRPCAWSGMLISPDSQRSPASYLVITT
jgi:hypothetical protein